ncbi:MAG: asparagine synthase (glutamine-hydrolyzing) [Gammaproteobacteria bacterium]|nr:asparagine synthase (glutamine-hydrolyzing) [Gammaproteobacteria bacterium]
MRISAGYCLPKVERKSVSECDACLQDIVLGRDILTAMCGISVIINDKKAAGENLIRAMCDRITHRGPDSGGYHIAGPVALGMRRLRVIDLSTGDQPIFNADRSLAIVFNGEIYNYRELRDGLEAKGHRFETESDTEVVVHLYEEYGADAVQQLNGMFAFAIHERESGRVFMARDRLGIKPFHYAETADGLVVGSEIKSLLEVPGVNRAIDHVALDQYFSLLYVPAPRTMFEGIRKLPPGCTLVKTPGRPIEISRYWSLKSQPFEDRSENDLIEEFRQRFDTAVARQLVADVPLGVFLSGGVDSGALVASMSRAGADIHSLSLGFPSEYHQFDEREAAKTVAARYGTRHEEIIIEPDISNTLQTLAETFDEPLGDSGAVPNYLICKGAKSSVTVALSGLGGDELSAGYQRHLGMKIANLYRKTPSFVRETLIKRLVDALPEPEGGVKAIDQAKRFVKSAALPEVERFFAFSSPMDRDERASLYTADLERRVELDSALEIMRKMAADQPDADFINRMLCIDIQAYMVDDLLAVADRTSMAASLEVRVPYLDHDLVEFMAGVAGRFKLRGLRKKSFLKESFKNDLPDEILNRKKMGFSLPVARWLREDLRPMLEDSLSENRIKRDGLFDATTVQRLMHEHFTRKRDRSTVLWSILMFHNWADQYT